MQLRTLKVKRSDKQGYARVTPVSQIERIAIAARLLELQKQGKLVVWIDADRIQIAEESCAGSLPDRQRITWEQAAEVVGI